MTRRVVCIGDLMVDVVARHRGELVHGSDTPATVRLCGGGSAANTAAWLAAAGCPVTLVARVGDDALGRQALDDLRAAGVDLAVTVDPERPTGTCVVLVDGTGERTMLPSAGANAGSLAVPELLDDHLHVSGYALFHDASREAVRAAVRRSRTVSVDAASAAPLRAYGPDRFLNDIGPVLLFANAAEAAVFAGSRDPEGAVRQLGQRCGEAVVKHGADGAWWSDGRDVVHVAAPVTAVVDSTGAGDAFAAGFLAARRAGAAVDDALAAGHALAVRTLGRAGARP